MVTEDDLRAELQGTDYERAFGADGQRIRERDQELLRDLMRRRWREHGLTDQEREGLERWRARRGT